MEIVRQVAGAMQQVLGPEAEPLGRAAGLIRRRRKFTAVALLRVLVLTLLRRPDARPADYQVTAAQLGLGVSPAALPRRFRPALTAFLRAALGGAVGRALAAPPSAAALLRGFTSVRVGDATTVPLADELAGQFPGCGGKSGSGRAALKVQVLWDLLAGSLLRLVIEPGAVGDARSPIAHEPAPAGSLSLFDLGYFDLGRFRALAAGGASWVSRLQFGTAVFDPDGRPLGPLGDLPRGPAGGPIDRPALLGAAERLPCRLIALRVPPEVAARRRQKAYEKAQKHGRVPSREYLAWQDWTAYVTDCEAARLPWKGVVVLYRARWQIELLFKLWKSHNRLAAHRPGAPAEEQLAVVYAKLIGAVVQHWVLLTATWSDCRRSLRKAARVLRDWVVALTEALDDPDRLASVLNRLKAALGDVARVQPRRGHPSHFQLLNDPELLDYSP